MILDASGNEVVFEPRAIECPRCGSATRSDRTLITGLGGHWRVVCRCGHTHQSGVGEPPFEGEY